MNVPVLFTGKLIIAAAALLGFSNTVPGNSTTAQDTRAYIVCNAPNFEMGALSAGQIVTLPPLPTKGKLVCHGKTYGHPIYVIVRK